MLYVQGTAVCGMINGMTKHEGIVTNVSINGDDVTGSLVSFINCSSGIAISDSVLAIIDYRDYGLTLDVKLDPIDSLILTPPRNKAELS